MASQVTNYQCPACTGPLQFDAQTGKLSCEYCSSTFTVEEIEALYQQKNEDAAQAQTEAEARRESARAEAEEGGWDTSGLNGDWGTDAEGMRVYNCPSCGAELICEETTAATSCPYCGNPSVVPGQLGGALKPDLVIPFAKSKKEAIAALKEHYKGRPLLPKAFKEANHLEEIKGVYVPFWLFDGEAEGDAQYHATNVSKYRSGNYEVTRTDHYQVTRGGSVAFENIPVDGSKKMPDDYMDSIEPFDYSQMTAFSTAYLPGFMADKYDVSAEESSSRADTRAESTLISSLRGTITGYDSVMEEGHNVRLHRGKVKYALLPVWLLTTKWQDKNYLFAMNGQTGKFVGTLPVDKKKKWSIFAIVTGAVAAVTAVIVLFPGGLLKLLGM